MSTLPLSINTKNVLAVEANVGGSGKGAGRKIVMVSAKLTEDIVVWKLW